MASTLQIVDEADEVLLDLNGATTSATGTTTCSLLHDPDWGSPVLQSSVVEDSTVDVGTTTFHRRALADCRLRVRIQGDSFDALSIGVGRLAQLLSQGCIMKWIPHGTTEVRYADIEPSPTPVLFGGQELSVYKATVLFDQPDGVELTFQRQPYFRGAALTPTTNILINPTLLLDTNDDGTPNDWTLGGSFSSDLILAEDEAMQAVCSTNGTSVMLEQTTAAASASSGQVWAGSVYVRIKPTSSSGASASLSLNWRTAANASISTSTGTVTALSNSYWTRIAVSGTAPATTDRIRFHINIVTTDTTARTYQLSNAQLEFASSISAFRVGDETVYMDPTATGFAKVLPVFNPGTAPAPCQLKLVFPDASSAITRATFGLRTSNSIPGYGRLSDYLNGPNYAQCDASGAGWTTTLAAVTTQTADANASGGNMARIASTTTYTKAITWTRTADLDSMRGPWDVYLRVKAAAAKLHRFRLKWGIGNVDPAPNVEPEARHNTQDINTGYDYVWIKVGRIRIPREASVTLGTLRLELWTRIGAGTANIDADYLSFVPADDGATATMPFGSQTLYDGSELTSPVSNPAGGTAGATTQTNLRLNDTTDNGGVTLTGTGFHFVRFRLASDGKGTATVKIVIRNTTDSADVVTKTVTLRRGSSNVTESLVFSAAAGKTYQAQVDDPASFTDYVMVKSIKDTFIPAIIQNQMLLTDPGSVPSRQDVEWLDTSGNIMARVDSTGVPFWIPPGLNLIYIDVGDTPPNGYDEAKTTLTRTVTVSPTVYPRWWS